jgi:hypothetical protein
MRPLYALTASIPDYMFKNASAKQIQVAFRYFGSHRASLKVTLLDSFEHVFFKKKM